MPAQLPDRDRHGVSPQAAGGFVPLRLREKLLPDITMSTPRKAWALRKFRVPGAVQRLLTVHRGAGTNGRFFDKTLLTRLAPIRRQVKPDAGNLM
jgi:hypothetical protein